MIKLVGDSETNASIFFCPATPINSVTLFFNIAGVWSSNFAQSADIYLRLFNFSADNCSGTFWSDTVFAVVSCSDVPGCQVQNFSISSCVFLCLFISVWTSLIFRHGHRTWGVGCLVRSSIYQIFYSTHLIKVRLRL